MMDTRKITLIAIIAIIALAAVGVGYAYTAMTVNQGNNAAPEFITLSQGDGAVADYTFTYDEDTANTEIIYWDSANYSNGTAVVNDYTLASKVTTLTLPDTNKYTTVQVGKDITLHATQDAGTIKDTIDVTISTVNFNIGDDENLKLIVKVTKTGSSDPADTQFFMVKSTDVIKGYDTSSQAADKWTADPVFTTAKKDTTNYYDYTISVFFGYPETDGKYIKNSDTAAKPTNKPLQEAKILFRASTDSYNDQGSEVTAFTIKAAGDADSVAVGQDLQLSAVFTGGSNTSVVVWYSSDNAIATVDSTGKVHGVAPANVVTITAQSTDGAVIQTIDLEVTQ